MSSELAAPPPAAPAPPRRRRTYDELAAEVGETTQRGELWDGIYEIMSSPSFVHQLVTGRLFVALDAFTFAPGISARSVIAPFDMVLTPHLAPQPDVLFVRKDRRALIQGVLRGPADLVMEVISPDRRARDRVDKRDLYAQHGIPEYWLIDPDARTVEVLALREGEYRLAVRARPGESAASALLPGFAVDAAALFEGLDDQA